jgi:DNA-binding transcriptional regulator YhcF (GntR family)
VEREAARPFYEQVRDQLINAIHFGAIKPGTRLPTVRQLARDGAINLKTAFKIYQGLAEEGLVEIRPQSGVYVRSTQPSAERAYRRSVVSFLRRVIREAGELNLSLPRFVHLLSLQEEGSPEPGISCALLECNPEQTHLVAGEIQERLKVRVIPVVMRNGSVGRQERQSLRAVDFLVTTDFHWDEVSRLAEQVKKKAFKVSLDPSFLQAAVDAARRGTLGLILTDTTVLQVRFREVFSAYLTPEQIERVRFVRCDDRRGIQALLKECDYLYVSPLCRSKVVPDGMRRPKLLKPKRVLSPESLDELRENLMFYPLG